MSQACCITVWTHQNVKITLRNNTLVLYQRQCLSRVLSIQGQTWQHKALVIGVSYHIPHCEDNLVTQTKLEGIQLVLFKTKVNLKRQPCTNSGLWQEQQIADTLTMH